MNKYVPQYELVLGEEEKRELLETIEANWISEGPKTKKFEEIISEFLGVNYAAVVPNGTLAITTACLALGIGKGDEVIISDLTMVGTATGAILAGAIPVFADVKEDNFNINPQEVERKITKSTKAIIIVHLNGRACDMKTLLKLAKKYNLKIIEDAAQAFGSKSGSKYFGTLGDIGCFSFSVPKVVTTAQGGMVTTNNKSLYEKILRLKDQGRRQKGVDIHDTIGFNFRFSDIQAALGIAQMKKLRKNLQKKRQIYKLYTKFLEDTVQVKFIETNLGETAPWFVDIYVEKRGGLIKYLAKNKVGTRKIYPAMHSHKAFKTFVSEKETFPNAQEASRMGLWLPSSMNLTKAQIKRVCGLIRNYYS